MEILHVQKHSIPVGYSYTDQVQLLMKFRFDKPLSIAQLAHYSYEVTKEPACTCATCQSWEIQAILTKLVYT
jgi:hypothetical protein